AGQFQDPDLAIISNEVAMEDAIKKITKELKRPFFIEMDRTGRINGVRLSANVSVHTSTMIRTLLACCQFVLPGRDGSKDSWEVKENDPLGHSIATYERTEQTPENKGCKVLVKSVEEYEPVDDELELSSSELPLKRRVVADGTVVAEVH